MADVTSTPPLRWLFGDAEQRRKAFRYWIEDTFVGVIDLGIHFGLRLLPIDWCSRIGIHLGLFGRVRYPRSDARAHKAISRFFPGAGTEAATAAAVTRLWRGVGRTMAEYSILDRLWRAGRIEVEGVEHLDAARAAGRPRLVMGLHLGNWETIPPTLIAVGHPGSGIYLPPDNRFDHYISVIARERYGAKLVAPGPHTSRAALQALKANEGIFIIYVDEFIRGRVQAPALGRPISASGSGSNLAYVARLAGMSNAAIIPAYCVRKGEGAHFKVTFLPAVDLQRTSDRMSDTDVNVGRLDAVIDPLIRTHMDQWFYVLDLELES